MFHSRNNLMFSEDEERFYLWFRNIREPFVAPFVKFFVKTGVHPDTLSYMGLGMMVPFLYFFMFNPWVAFFFLLLQIFFDGLDGPLARQLNKESARGAFLDITVDYVSFVVVFFACLYVGLLSPFWAAAHVLNYAVMQSFILFSRIKNIQVFPVVRPKLLFYLIFFIWLLTGQNYFDPFLVVTTVYLVVSNFFLFIRIRCSL